MSHAVGFARGGKAQYIRAVNSEWSKDTMDGSIAAEDGIRHDWTRDEVAMLFALPFADLMYRAQGLHRARFDPNRVQVSTLLSIKTGGCPEDCAYCPQSAHHDAGVEAEKLMPLAEVVEAAQKARNGGATRFCMGAAWRSPKDRDIEEVSEMVREVGALGLETCMTLGMLTASQADTLADAGLDYYNHNLDTAPEFYGNIISTRTYQERLDTLDHVRDAGIKVCCGGIVGMGEDRAERVGLLHMLASLPTHPESVPINALVAVAGTPLEDRPPVDPLDLVRMCATARILMPESRVRLSAGRRQLSREAQVLCFLAGANSIFYGETLLTTANAECEEDRRLLQELGLSPLSPEMDKPAPASSAV